MSMLTTCNHRTLPSRPVPTRLWPGNNPRSLSAQRRHASTRQQGCVKGSFLPVPSTRPKHPLAATSDVPDSQSPIQPASPPTAVQISRAFFSRPQEEQMLTAALLAPPTELLLLVGPRGSGKTALLRQVTRQLAADRRIRLSYIDGSKYDMTCPAGLARQLAANLAHPDWLGLLSARTPVGKAGDAEGGAGGATAEVGVAAGATAAAVAVQPASRLLQHLAKSGADRAGGGGPEQSARGSVRGPTHGSPPSLDDVLLAYEELLERQQSGDRAAVILFDGCEVLRGGREGGCGGRSRRRQGGGTSAAEYVGRLLRFLRWAGCQGGSARVVLATHDGTFADWLGESIGYGSFRTEVLGDLAAAEVPAFLRHLLPSPSDLDLGPEALHSIIQVCGSNTGALTRWAAAYRGDVHEALRSAGEDVAAQVRQALLYPGFGAGFGAPWSADQFATAVHALLASGEEQAVALEDLLRQLGGVEAGGRALRSMLEAGLLAVQPAGLVWARAGPGAGWRAAAGGRQGCRLVVAASPVHLHAMRSLWLELGWAVQRGHPQPVGPPGAAAAAVASNAASAPTASTGLMAVTTVAAAAGASTAYSSRPDSPSAVSPAGLDTSAAYDDRLSNTPANRTWGPAAASAADAAVGGGESEHIEDVSELLAEVYSDLEAVQWSIADTVQEAEKLRGQGCEEGMPELVEMLQTADELRQEEEELKERARQLIDRSGWGGR